MSIKSPLSSLAHAENPFEQALNIFDDIYVVTYHDLDSGIDSTCGKLLFNLALQKKLQAYFDQIMQSTGQEGRNIIRELINRWEIQSYTENLVFDQDLKAQIDLQDIDWNLLTQPECELVLKQLSIFQKTDIFQDFLYDARLSRACPFLPLLIDNLLENNLKHYFLDMIFSGPQTFSDQFNTKLYQFFPVLALYLLEHPDRAIIKIRQPKHWHAIFFVNSKLSMSQFDQDLIRKSADQVARRSNPIELLCEVYPCFIYLISPLNQLLDSDLYEDTFNSHPTKITRAEDYNNLYDFVGKLLLGSQFSQDTRGKLLCITNSKRVFVNQTKFKNVIKLIALARSSIPVCNVMESAIALVPREVKGRQTYRIAQAFTKIINIYEFLERKTIEAEEVFQAEVADALDLADIQSLQAFTSFLEDKEMVLCRKYLGVEKLQAPAQVARLQSVVHQMICLVGSLSMTVSYELQIRLRNALHEYVQTGKSQSKWSRRGFKADSYAAYQNYMSDWKSCTSLSRGNFAAYESDDFYQILNVGESPVSTCYSWNKGMFADQLVCLLSNGDRKPLMLERRQSLIARALLCFANYSTVWKKNVPCVSLDNYYGPKECFEYLLDLAFQKSTQLGLNLIVSSEYVCAQPLVLEPYRGHSFQLSSHEFHTGFTKKFYSTYSFTLLPHANFNIANPLIPCHSDGILYAPLLVSHKRRP